MAATIATIAKEAGVSVATVSRALTKPEKVDPATRARILEHVARLGYTANRAARALATGRTGNIAVIVPDITNPQFGEMVKTLQFRAEEANQTVLLFDACENAHTESTLISALAPQVDGIIFCGSRLNDGQLLRARQSVPVVLINRHISDIPGIIIEPTGLHQAVYHLHTLEHRRIGYLGGPDISSSQQARLATAHKTATQLGIELTDLGSYRSDFAGGAEAINRVLESKVTAVLTYNDLTATALIHHLADRGRRVPHDLSVIGFNDLPLAALTQPPLTTIKFPRQAAAMAAIDLLQHILQPTSQPTRQTVTLPTTLVIRQSTGPAPMTSRTTPA